MEFRDLIKNLPVNLEPLPGEDAQFRMAPFERLRKSETLTPDIKPKLSAVLILVYAKSSMASIALILRKEYPGTHSGQVSFPGGKPEDSDASLQETALRETQEEIGIDSNTIEIIGPLSDIFIPPSGFLVQPFIGFTETSPVFIPDPKEVQEVIELPVKTLLSDSIVGETDVIISTGKKIRSPYFNINGHVVWGATAMMLSELKEILQRIES